MIKFIPRWLVFYSALWLGCAPVLSSSVASSRSFLAPETTLTQTQLAMALAVFHDCNNLACAAMNLSILLRDQDDGMGGSDFKRLIQITGNFESLSKQWSKLGINPSVNARLEIIKTMEATSADTFLLAQSIYKRLNMRRYIDRNMDDSLSEIIRSSEKIMTMCQVLFNDSEFAFSEIDIDFFLANLVGRMRELSNTKISYYPAESYRGSSIVVGNSCLIELAFMNIVNNALNHGKAPLIMVKTVARDRNFEVQIINLIGEGGKRIDPYWLEEVDVTVDGKPVKIQRLFVEYFTTSKADGHAHGIGMKLIWAYLAPMGVTVSVESQEHKTIYKLMFPLNKNRKDTPSGRMRLLKGNGSEAISLTPPNGTRTFVVEAAL